MFLSVSHLGVEIRPQYAFKSSPVKGFSQPFLYFWVYSDTTSWLARHLAFLVSWGHTSNEEVTERWCKSQSQRQRLTWETEKRLRRYKKKHLQWHRSVEHMIDVNTNILQQASKSWQIQRQSHQVNNAGSLKISVLASGSRMGNVSSHLCYCEWLERQGHFWVSTFWIDWLKGTITWMYTDVCHKNSLTCFFYRGGLGSAYGRHKHVGPELSFFT